MIEFEGRDLVWHELGLSDGQLEPAYDFAPTVTVVVENVEAEEELYGLILRFLAAVAFRYDVGAMTHNPGGSGETDPLHPAVSRQRYALFVGKLIVPAPQRVEVAVGEGLGQALGVYREGVSAASPYLGWFAFWNAIEAAHDGVPSRVDEFLNAETPNVVEDVDAYVESVLTLALDQPEPRDIAEYFRQHGRAAIAHVKRDRPPYTEINPDDPADRFRLDADTWVLRSLARRAIEATWPHPVSAIASG
jgi:hypothetical protein